MKDKLLFFKPSDSTFILKDQKFLSEHYHLVPYKFTQGKSITLFWEYFKQSLFLIKEILTSNFVFIWFADYHSLLPILFAKIFSKKSFIVLGGADTVYIKKYKYGVFSNFFRSYCAKYSIRNVNILLPVDQSLIDRLENYVPESHKKSILVPTGYDSKLWYCDSKKENLVVTVAKFSTYNRMMIKGIDRFIELAKANPELEFKVIGVTSKGKAILDKIGISKNVTLAAPLDSKELRKEYSRAKYYAQLSRSEGLPNAVCEAMLCECIPICTNVGGMRNLVAENGILIDFPHTKDSIISLTNRNQNINTKNLRILIKNQFSVNNRYNNLKSAFNF